MGWETLTSDSHFKPSIFSFNTRVFLGNVAPSVRERDIEKSFETFGRIYDVKIMMNKGCIR